MNKYFDWILGKPEDVDKPMKWYHWLFLAIKILTPIIAIVALILKNYYIGSLLILATLMDIYFIYDLHKRYELYKECEKIKVRGTVRK